MSKKTLTLPPSVSHLGLNMFGFACCLSALMIVRFWWPDTDIFTLSLIAMVATILPIFVVELRFFKVQDRSSTGLQKPGEVNAERIAVKVVGLIGTLAFLGFLYWLLPEYKGDNYDRYWQLLNYGIPLLVLFSIPYFWWMDGRMKEPEDAYWQMGLLVMLQWEEIDIYLIGRHLRNWLVKAFFLPLMFTYLGGNAQMIVHYNFENMTSFGGFFDYANNFLFFADLIFAGIGYAMTFRFLDSHIRSSEPTFRGWVVAIMCYAPLWQTLFYGHYFAYDDNLFWGNWLSNMPVPYFFWGVAILCLETIYATATVCLGYRFSNLTYRGLVASGPYRFTKHPAYVAKNTSWWLISIPFISDDGFSEALRHSVLLFGVNLIYYIRAKTEENHLSRYPEYIQYALYMNENGIFAPLTKFLPFLKYKAPAQAATTVQDKV